MPRAARREPPGTIRPLLAAALLTALASSAFADRITVFSDDFSTLDSAKWASTSGLYGGTVYSGGTSYTSYFPTGASFYFNAGTGTTRQAVTQQINMSRKVATVAFSLRYETTGGGLDAFPFEDIDNNEEIVVEWSTNGSTWTEVARYENTDNSYRTWANTSISLPSGAWATTTQLRFRQRGNSGTNFDQWAIDNLTVIVNPEPGTWALFGVAAAALAAFVRRRRSARRAAVRHFPAAR